jgi:hypothetical protein
MKKYILFVVLIGMSACSGQFFTPYDQAGRINLSADEKGMRAFSDLMTGLVNEGKNPKGNKSSHYQLREAQERTNQMSWQVKMQQRFQKEVNHE